MEEFLFDITLAAKLAVLANMSYDDNISSYSAYVKTELNGKETMLIRLGKDNEIYRSQITYNDKNYYLIMIRGTEITPINWYDVLSNADLEPSRYVLPHLYFHDGFHRRAEQVRQELSSYFSKHNPDHYEGVIICGHSMGASVASILNVMINCGGVNTMINPKDSMPTKRVVTYAFGAPGYVHNSSNIDYDSYALHTNLHTVIHKDDYMVNMFNFAGYTYYGNRVYLDKDQVFYGVYKRMNGIKYYLTMIWQKIMKTFKGNQGFLGGHDIEQYILLLDGLAKLENKK